MPTSIKEAFSCSDPRQALREKIKFSGAPAWQLGTPPPPF